MSLIIKSSFKASSVRVLSAVVEDSNLQLQFVPWETQMILNIGMFYCKFFQELSLLDLFAAKFLGRHTLTSRPVEMTEECVGRCSLSGRFGSCTLANEPTLRVPMGNEKIHPNTDQLHLNDIKSKINASMKPWLIVLSSIPRKRLPVRSIRDFPIPRYLSHEVLQRLYPVRGGRNWYPIRPSTPCLIATKTIN